MWRMFGYKKWRRLHPALELGSVAGSPETPLFHVRGSSSWMWFSSSSCSAIGLHHKNGDQRTAAQTMFYVKQYRRLGSQKLGALDPCPLTMGRS